MLCVLPRSSHPPPIYFARTQLYTTDHQMIRFWITYCWQHPAIKDYDVVMRLDSDACWENRCPSPIPETLPGPPLSSADGTAVVYHAGLEKFDFPKVSMGWAEFVHDYVAKHNITVQNPELFRKIPIPSDGNDSDDEYPIFYNNFEVVRVAFMQQANVQHFPRSYH